MSDNRDAEFEASMSDVAEEAATGVSLLSKRALLLERKLTPLAEISPTSVEQITKLRRELRVLKTLGHPQLHQ